MDYPMYMQNLIPGDHINIIDNTINVTDLISTDIINCSIDPELDQITVAEAIDLLKNKSIANHIQICATDNILEIKLILDKNNLVLQGLNKEETITIKGIKTPTSQDSGDSVVNKEYVDKKIKMAINDAVTLILNQQYPIN